MLFAKPFKLFHLVFRLFYKVWRPFSGDEIRSSSSRLELSSSCSRHFGFQKKRTVKCGPLNWPIIPYELNERYDKRTYLELNSINIPTLLYHIVSYHSKFFSDKEQKLNMHMRETGKALNRILITCTSAYSYQTEWWQNIPAKNISNGKRQLCYLTLNKFSYSIRSYWEGRKDPYLFGHAINILRDFKSFKSVLFWRVSYIAGKHLSKRTSHILRHFKGNSYGRGLMNSDKWHLVKCTVIFTTIFFELKKLVSNKFIQNLHFTEEHKLVRLSWKWYLWNTKQAKVLNI